MDKLEISHLHCNILATATWLLLGLFFFHTKLFSLNSVWKFWANVWKSAEKYEVLYDTDLNHENYHESIFSIVFMETFPHFILQITNNTLLKVWTPVAILSTCTSALMLASTIYQFFYYRLWKGNELSEIPVKSVILDAIQIVNPQIKIAPVTAVAISAKEERNIDL
jgi:hypothetical protein